MLAARLSVLLFAAASSPLALSETIIVPTQVSTIQAAIDRAEPLDVVLVEPGTYRENIVLKTQISVLGRETARTLLQPQSASDPTVQISLANDLLFSGFTLTGASTGVEVSGSLNIRITNVVFASASEAGIDVVNSEVEVADNVFFGNAIAVRRNTTTVEISSNIFRSNDVTISGGTDNDVNVEANCWSDNDDLRPVGGAEMGYGVRPTVGNPLFVSEGDRDFHLKEGSPCIDTGIGVDVIDSTVADSGAYGGPFADAFPMPVTGVTLTDASAGGKAALTATWSPNLSYLVTHSTLPGGYRFYYKQGSAGPPYDGTDAGGGMQASPIDVGNVTTFTLSDLAPVKPLPAPTQLLGATPHNEAVELTWQAAAGASGYRIHYGIGSTAENHVDAGNVTTFSVTGLANGTIYRFAVGTLSSATYFVVVTAHDSTPQRHESAPSEEASVQAGGTEEAALSNELTARPEQTVAYPTLPDEGGCFIATAAYGADWQAEVQALRDFRDRYLLPYAAGRWFVGRYYELSPGVAAYIDDHPSTKPVVRSLLTPLVVFALFLLGSTASTKAGVAALLGCLVVLELSRRRRNAARRARSAITMLSRGIRLAFTLVACVLSSYGVRAQEPAVESPRWTYELRGVYFEPDLELFETFYGDNADSYFGIAGTYRFRDWLEVGGEYGLMKETGAGLLTESGALGGTVELRLEPVQVFANAIFQRSVEQRVVPYVGAGLMVVRYEQKVDFQDDIEGRTDAGWSARAGVRFLIKTREPTRTASSTSAYWRALVFLEAQHMSAEVDDIDLGGDAVVVGFRMEFDLN